ncbi:MAG: M48 family metallopeptidase [Elusimicrobiales bacterium]
MSVSGLMRDVRDFLKDLSRDLPDVFPQRPVYRRALRRARLPRPSAADRERARAIINARAAHWAALLGVKYNRIAIKGQRSLWGSCSRRGNLNFNWRLAAAPPEALDYVVVHELCHLREMNHSPRFWAHVASACPDYKTHRRWLRDNTADLMAVSALA